ncbi:PHD finger protein 14 [Actinomortierella wolfii]|nr:PHD finger protein 14 [Actinomortierella wolfii]
MTCYICSDPADAALGACVQCDAGQCRKSFHVTCAQAYSLLETVEDPGMADPYFTFCKQHGSANGGEPKLNGWAKWVKRRDALLKQWQTDQGYQRTKRFLELQREGGGGGGGAAHRDVAMASSGHGKGGRGGSGRGKGTLSSAPKDLVADDDFGGVDTGLVEIFEDSYSRFKAAREQRIARDRSELSRQYSIGYYLGNRIDKSRTRLEAVHQKAEQALLEQQRIEARTRALLSSLLECAAYLESMSPSEPITEGPLSIDTTLEWYNALPDTSRWKSDIQDIIETIDIDSLEYDSSDSMQYPSQDFGGGAMDDQIVGTVKNGAKGKLGRPPKHASVGAVRQGYHEHYYQQHPHHPHPIYHAHQYQQHHANHPHTTTNSKSKKLQPKPTMAAAAAADQGHATVVSSRGRPIRKDFGYSDYSSGADVAGSGVYSSSSDYSPVIPKPAVRAVMPCAICHQLTLPEEKMALERDENGNISATAIKVLNKMVTCDTCDRSFHPKCLDPPMARAPPKGYSWNCEDCDSSEEDEDSSGNEGEDNEQANPGSRHHHSRSNDLDEALMVLADTAMSMSASTIGSSTGSGGKVKRKSSKAKGGERATVVGGKAKPPGLVVKPYTKMIKAESGATKAPAQVGAVGQGTKAAAEASMARSTPETTAGAPIIRGNLRIYPPGPFVSNTANADVGKKKKKVKAEHDVEMDDAQVTSPTASKAGKGAKPATGKASKASSAATTSTTKATKADAAPASASQKKKKVKTEDTTKPATAAAAPAKKAKKAPATATATAATPAKSKKAAAALTVNTKTSGTAKSGATSASAVTPTSGKANSTNKKTAATSSPLSPTGASPAVTAPAAPPKPTIKYAVGQKTIEELNAKADAEIERVNNVKFRRLRGRTLAMPDGPLGAGPSGVIDAATLEAIHANGI